MQNVSEDERIDCLIAEVRRQTKKIERVGLDLIKKTFDQICRTNAMRAEMRPHDDTVISFEQAQSLPEYQAELDSVRSDSFFSPSSISLSDDDIEKYSKMMAFVNFSSTKKKDQSSDHSEPGPSKQMRM